MDFEHDGLEKRSVPFSTVEITEGADSASGVTFRGYAAIYGQEADLGEFTEEIARGAFRKVLLPRRGRVQNVPFLYDHDDRHPPMATTQGKTLRLEEDANGLLVEADLDEDHYLTPTIRSMVRRGDISGMSFGFVAGPGNSTMEHRGGKPHRIVTGFKYLLDVSPTWNPVYEGTSAEVRHALRTLRMAEEIDSEQQVLAGTYLQREDGDRAEVGTDDADAEKSVEKVETEKVETEKVETETVKPVEADDDADDSGAEEQRASLAARKRRLEVMRLSLPKDFR